MMLTGTTAPVTTSLLSYDEAGHLVGHYANAAKVADATETVWLGDMPVAIVKPANTFYIHSDHMNAPRQISNANRDPVWAWEPVEFGANAPCPRRNSAHRVVDHLRVAVSYGMAESIEIVGKSAFRHSRIEVLTLG